MASNNENEKNKITKEEEEEESGRADAPAAIRQVEIPAFRGLRRSQEELEAKNKAKQELANSSKAPIPAFRGLSRTEEELEAKKKGRPLSGTVATVSTDNTAPATNVEIPAFRGLRRSQEELEMKQKARQERAESGALLSSVPANGGSTGSQQVGPVPVPSFRGLSRSQEELEVKRNKMNRANTGTEQEAGQVQIPAFRGLRRSPEELQAKQGTQAGANRTAPSSMPTFRGLAKQRLGRPPTRSDDVESGQELQMDESSVGDDRETDSESSLHQDREAEVEDQAANEGQLSQNIVEDVEAAGDDDMTEALQQTDPAPETAPDPLLSRDASTSDLVEAMPVLEEEEPPEGRVEAQPVDLEAANQKEMEQKRQRLGFCLISISCLVFAAIVGAVLGTRQPPTIPVINTTAPMTMAPTVSAAPTSTPTSAPTTTVDLFQINLPEYTQDSLDNPDSAQSQALKWLSEDHPEFYNMTEQRREQLFALATFYYSLGGPNWPDGLGEDWLDPAVNECNWFSRFFGSFSSTLTGPGTTYNANDDQQMSPCDSNRTVLSLYLSDLDLAAATDTPAIPPEVQLLTSLTMIHLEGNSIDTALSNLAPSQLGQMPSLSFLILQKQRIRGSIPPHIGLMTQLNILEISRNAITGTIPTEIGLMQKMIGFHADGNALTGTIPSEIGLPTDLFSLKLNGNDLTGSVPSEIGLLTDLISIDLQDTLITGSLPIELFQLTNLMLLQLPEGVLQGTTPTELGLLTSLMTKPVFNEPEEEAASTSSILSDAVLDTALMVLNLDGRSLTGTIPTEIGLLKSVMGINLSGNFLSGPIPTELALCTRLLSLRLGNNFLTGSIPSELGLFGSRVMGFDLHGNSLTGEIPSELGLLQGAVKIDLSDNLLGSSIFTEVGLLSDISMLYLQNNALNGTIPSEMGLLDGYNGAVPDLRIDLSNNSLTGPIPVELASATALKILHVADNDLSGTIPEELVSLVVNGILSDLDLGGNAFSGVVSEELCGLQDDSCTWYDGIHAKDYLPCHFSFDCSDALCGCNCTCT